MSSRWRKKTKQMTQRPSKDSKTTAEHGLEFLDAVDEMLVVMNGYRAKLITNGYSETAAEQMVVQLHANFMASMAQGSNQR